MNYPRPRGYRPGEHSVECMYTGFRMLASEMTRDYNGVLVRRKSVDYKHPQELAPITGEEDVPENTYPRRYDLFVPIAFISDPSQERS